MEENVEIKDQPSKERLFAVGVQFRDVGKIYTFATSDAALVKGDAVLVDSEEGSSIGYVALPPNESSTDSLPENVKKIRRRATDEELAARKKLHEKEIECLRACRDMALSKGLPMKMVDAEISDDGKKIIFIFFAEQRVDFRALVKELAVMLRLRIEMRQIGSRDEAKSTGCLGPCGLTTCCSTHLRQFQSISISMAKGQGLAPNPAKLTGMCGKLKCCLAYECAAYDECRKGLPKMGAAVETPKGSGKVVGHNVLKRECQVRLYAGGEARLPCDSCKPLSAEEREAAMTAARQAQESQNEERERRRGRRDRNGKNRKEEKNGQKV